MLTMRRFFPALLTLAAFLAAPLLAQDEDALSRWGEATLDKLVPFLPDASGFGFTPESTREPYDFKAFANDTPHRYPALLVHKTWYFNDPALSRELDELQKQKQALKKEMEEALSEFHRTHGAEMEAYNKKHLADAQSVSHSHAEEINALSKQAQDFFQQGKIQEGKAVLEKIQAIATKDQDKLQPAGYAPLEELTDSFKKKQEALDEREGSLSVLRRSVSFRIYTNRTPNTTAFAYPAKAAGSLAGRALYRQVREDLSRRAGRKEAAVNLAIYLGPANFFNPHIKAGEWDHKVKCIVVWAWIESLPDTIQGDEAAAKKVLANIDYDGLAKLVEP
jgi:hypothetical protein